MLICWQCWMGEYRRPIYPRSAFLLNTCPSIQLRPGCFQTFQDVAFSFVALLALAHPIPSSQTNPASDGKKELGPSSSEAWLNLSASSRFVAESKSNMCISSKPTPQGCRSNSSRPHGSNWSCKSNRICVSFAIGLRCSIPLWESRPVFVWNPFV